MVPNKIKKYFKLKTLLKQLFLSNPSKKRFQKILQKTCTLYPEKLKQQLALSCYPKKKQEKHVKGKGKEN